MATALTPKQALGSYPALPLVADSADFTWAAADVAGNIVPCTGRELILFRNDDIASQTVTISSVADGFNRKGDIAAYSIGAGEYAVLGLFEVQGWKQSDGNLLITASDADVKIAVIRLP